MVASAPGLTDVLVVGAGPTGLTAALQAHLHGAGVRLVERRPDALRPSRAMVVHPRTLELLRPLGVTDALLERADRDPGVVLHLGRRAVGVHLGDLALPGTEFPHLTVVRQSVVEEVLAGALSERGVLVERGVELVDLTTDEGGARATLDRGSVAEEVRAQFVVGCDGAASTVRTRAGIGWRGGDYREEVVLADLELEGALTSRLHHVAAARQGVVFLFARGERATWRMLATRPARRATCSPGQPGDDVAEADLQELLDGAGLGVTVRQVAWSASIPMQRRVADAFAFGPLFLAGDAAHTHSPAAAQGMNTGIADAVNLGWKLAGACRHPDRVTLLTSYDDERRPVARQVLALTHAAFTAEASTRLVPSLLRGTVAPLAAPLVPPLVRRQALVAAVARVLSQTWVRYGDSALSVEGVPGGPGPRPGDRLPDEQVLVDGRRTGLHEVVARPGVHVLVASGATAPTEVAGPLVTVRRIASWPGRGVSVVRPDGYVGLRSAVVDLDVLQGWLSLAGAG